MSVLAPRMSTQQALALPSPAPSNTVVINARCSVRIEADQRVIVVAGLPVHHYRAEDAVAEAYAMVFLVESGFAQQTDVARAFERSVRTVRRYQERYAHGGMAALGKEEGWRRGRRRISGKRLRSIEMLKCQGMSNRAIAHRLGVSENAIRKLVGPSKRESAQLALTAITPAAEKPATNAVPSATPSGEDGDHASRSAEEHPGDRDPFTAPEAEDEPVPMSLDRDADDRTFDRQLAYLGLLDDAAPLFREGASVPGVGVLLALPCLVESGLFRISRKLFGEIGPAFYGLRTTLLTLLLMAAPDPPCCAPLRRAARRGACGRACQSARTTWGFCTLTAMCVPITVNARSHQMLMWRAAIWLCLPPPTTGSTIARATRCW